MLELVMTEEVALETRLAVENIVKTVTNCISNADFEDLCSAGFVGALKAYNNYDPSKGCSLRSYINIRARGAILDELRSWDVLPRSRRFKIKVMETTQAKLQESLGRSPEDHELAAELNIDSEQLDQLKVDCDFNKQMSLDEDINGDMDEERLLHDIIADEKHDKFFMCRNDLYRWVREQVDKLKHAYKFVIQQYYFEDKIGIVIAKQLGVTESRVCQIRKEAIRILGVNLMKCGINGYLE